MDKDNEYERQRVKKRLDGVDNSTATNCLDYQDKIEALQQHTEASIATIKTTLVMQYDELQEEMKDQTLVHTSRHGIQEIEVKHEEVTEALGSIYTSIKEDLLTETKETLVAELDFEFQQDPTIKN
jgi:hypothetical protein